MTPIIAQLLLGSIQALIQVIQAKLAHEERLVIVIDPSHFELAEDNAALETVCGKAILLRRVGTHEAHNDAATVIATGAREAGLLPATAATPTELGR